MIEIGAPNTAPRARAVGHMHKVRTYANAVVLPDGKVVVNGGSQECEEFTDDAAVFQPGTAPGYFAGYTSPKIHPEIP